MRRNCLPLFFCVPLLLMGCERSNSITKEKTPSSSSEPSPAPAVSTNDSALAIDAHEEPKAIDSDEPPPEPDPAPEPVPTKKPAAVPETVNVRGKEYPYCRTPNEEGCIPRKSPTQAPVWK